MRCTCSVCDYDISDTVYTAVNGEAIQCSFSSLNCQTVRFDGIFASLRCLIPKQRNHFDKVLELALLGEYFYVYLNYYLKTAVVVGNPLQLLASSRIVSCSSVETLGHMPIMQTKNVGFYWQNPRD